MFRVIVVLMIVIPALEIWGLLTVGSWLGGPTTFGLILLTGFVGAFLARREASKVWLLAREQMSTGQIPGIAAIDGLCIFAGGLLLLTPGFLTDTIGFLLVFPATRRLFRGLLLAWLKRMVQSGRINVFMHHRR